MDAVLRKWWQGLGQAGQEAWYQRQQQLPEGTKRTFDTISVNQGSLEEEGTDELDEDDFVPWWLFVHYLQASHTMEQMVEKWDKAIASGSKQAKFKSGEGKLYIELVPSNSGSPSTPCPP